MKSASFVNNIRTNDAISRVHAIDKNKSREFKNEKVPSLIDNVHLFKLF